MFDFSVFGGFEQLLGLFLKPARRVASASSLRGISVKRGEMPSLAGGVVDAVVFAVQLPPKV